MTTRLGNIDTVVTPTEGAGVNQAVGGIAFSGDLTTREVSSLLAYVVQTGMGPGAFQMAVLRSITATTAEVIGVTNIVSSLSGGLFTLPLTAPVQIAGSSVYYLAVWNQVNGSWLGAETAGIGTIGDAPPINFRVQNLPTGFAVGQIINTSDIILRLTPWLAAMS